MFQKMLVATDGSELSSKAAAQAAALAARLGAPIVGYYAAPGYQLQVYADFVPPDFVDEEEYARQMREVSARYLSEIERVCSEAGVACSTHWETNDRPAEAIVAAAGRFACDAIAMGSHGRGGWSSLFLGSVTQRVLHLTRIPVVVFR